MQYGSRMLAAALKAKDRIKGLSRYPSNHIEHLIGAKASSLLSGNHGYILSQYPV